MNALRALCLLAVLLTLAACGARSVTPTKSVDKLATITANRLEHFSSDDALSTYMSDSWHVAAALETLNVQPVHFELGGLGVVADASQLSAMTSSFTASASSRVSGVVTPAPTNGVDNITNVQTHGVDEGDIVKKIVRFLIVLQDGRLFVVDTQPNGQPGLALVDRTNVYRDARDQMWYDETLVYGRRIVVTGYSYENSATEINVFSLSDAGRLTREAVYYISSNDYYDITNYATRLVGDKLVIYSPLYLRYFDPKTPIPWPKVRRWISGNESHASLTAGRPLYTSHDIFRPVQPTTFPTVHAITVCPLGTPAAGDELACTATAFVGPSEHELYVAPDAAYLWVSDEGRPAYTPVDCDARGAGAFTSGQPGVLYRVPFDGGAPGVMRVRGAPRDQLGLASTTTEFRALLAWNETSCSRRDEDHLTLKYFSAPIADFAATLGPDEPTRFHDAPGLDGGIYEERFTDAYVIYGAREDWSSYPPYAKATTARVVALPLANPSAATLIQAPHNVVRVERAGDDIIVDGYSDANGLSVSRIDLSATPHISATEHLAHRFEFEGRSHAFNAAVDESGAGLMGLPTVALADGGGRMPWDSTASDVSFLTLTPDGGLRSVGDLDASANAVDRSYHCEVSCVDWYGNTRPIFADGRIFALTGTEVIEGEFAAGGVRELRRLNISRAPPH